MLDQTSCLRKLLCGYEISLSLRFGRDSGRWKLVVKGPEKYVCLMMEINRALTGADCQPEDVVRNALLAAGPPPMHVEFIVYHYIVHATYTYKRSYTLI